MGPYREEPCGEYSKKTEVFKPGKEVSPEITLLASSPWTSGLQIVRKYISIIEATCSGYFVTAALADKYTHITATQRFVHRVERVLYLLFI